MIDNETLDTMLWKKVPRIKLELNFAQIKAIADLFAHIVDYKSPFTSNHSMGVAEGAEKISRFMGFDKDICQKMYIAGALHDIGKVAIGNEILEKPEKLTDEEFKTMKHHAVL
ncbi:HD-GYP domain-containing protein [Blautia obeum]|jgi:HD-GYP domain|uniref:HD-GYP domain-containing protein n=2 Tax=Blautia TaxID=572511 RepID=UPI001FA8936F|nr:HD domain-containing phosphohydrolase [Blautia obeum]